MISKHHQLVAAKAGLFANILDAAGEVFASIPLRVGVTYGYEVMPYLCNGMTLNIPQGVTHIAPPPRLVRDRSPAWVETGANPDFQPRPISDIERRMNETLLASNALVARMAAELRARGDYTPAPVSPVQTPSPVPETAPPEPVAENEAQAE